MIAPRAHRQLGPGSAVPPAPGPCALLECCAAYACCVPYAGKGKDGPLRLGLVQGFCGLLLKYPCETVNCGEQCCVACTRCSFGQARRRTPHDPYCMATTMHPAPACAGAQADRSVAAGCSRTPTTSRSWCTACMARTAPGSSPCCCWVCWMWDSQVRPPILLSHLFRQSRAAHPMSEILGGFAKLK